MPVIAPAEADPAAGERDEPPVGDRDAVCVAAEIGQDDEGATGFDPERPFVVGDDTSRL
jgi:hypothetical protein